MKNAALALKEALFLIRETRPFVHNVTNFVVMQTTANALLAIGASPIMAHAEEEVETIASVADALVINIGTLDSAWISAMGRAISAAEQGGVPIILDPAGAAASAFRMDSALHLIDLARPTVIRGNASEIMALASESVVAQGMDSFHKVEAAFDSGLILAKRYSTVVVISGEEDLIISEQAHFSIQNGVSMMTAVTGMGCTATALIGAFVAAVKHPAKAAAYAMASMGIAGEMAMEKAMGPGSFSVYFLDALYHLPDSDLAHRLKLMEAV